MAKRRKRTGGKYKKGHRKKDLEKEEIEKLEKSYARMRRNDTLRVIAVIVVLLVAMYAIIIMPESSSEAQITRPTPVSPSTPPPSQTPSSQQKVVAPDFTAIDVMTGESISLGAHKGTVVLLNFVNYGCDSETNKIVSAQLLTIRDLTEQRNDFTPISVFCGCCPADTLRNFAQQNNLSWSWILDSDYSIIKEYIDYVKNYGYPTLIFIDKEGYITDTTGYCNISTLSTKIDETID